MYKKFVVDKYVSYVDAMLSTFLQIADIAVNREWNNMQVTVC